ncbi:MAG: type II and III secretion system protein [Gloeocapsa sp. DLM2.Bin57]|nr:MAG: type II and III secretion system protein [Gloeocapsa sp. DLM2.Bin57]
MNSTGEFKTVEGTEGQESTKKPQMFGITMTPLVGGILLGLVGLGAFWYVWSSMVSPAMENKQELETDKRQKEGQLRQLKSGEVERRIGETQAELDRELQLEPQVFAMFSDENSLDTMLIDLNSSIEANQAKLVTFQPEGEGSVLITDGSLGELVNNRLKRQTNNVTIVGTFEQTQAVIQDIERLQPLLLIKDFQTQVSESPTYVYRQGQISVQGETILTTTFKIDAILPEDPANLAQPETEAEAEAAN